MAMNSRPPGRDRDGDVRQRVPQVAGLMQNAPRIDDVERPETLEVALVEHAALLDGPVVGVGEIAALELAAAGDAVRVVVERHDAGGAQPHRRQREQAAAAADVEEASARERSARPASGATTCTPRRSARRRARPGTASSSYRARDRPPRSTSARRWVVLGESIGSRPSTLDDLDNMPPTTCNRQTNDRQRRANADGSRPPPRRRMARRW